MGQPAHYSMDIVARCRLLLDELMPQVQGGLKGDERHGGPLTTTFLLAMATPMVALPIERLFKPTLPGEVVADDTKLHDGLSKEVVSVFDEKCTFANAPFNPGLNWRLLRDAPVFNIAQWGNEKELAKLDDAASLKAGQDASARFVMIHLRNALAHGGIIYLDKDGRQSDSRADTLGFVSTKIDWKTKKLEGLRVSRVSEADFLIFLRVWSDWIAKAGLQEVIAEGPPLAA